MVTHDPTIVLRSNYDTPAEVLADLRRGALDAAIVDNAAALSEIGRGPGVRLVDPALTLEPYVLAMPSEAFQLHAEVNRALDELRKEGFFDQLGRKWFIGRNAARCRLNGQGQVVLYRLALSFYHFRAHHAYRNSISTSPILIRSPWLRRCGCAAAPARHSAACHWSSQDR